MGGWQTLNVQALRMSTANSHSPKQNVKLRQGHILLEKLVFLRM